MISFGFTKRRLFLAIVALSVFLITSNLTALSNTDITTHIDDLRLPGLAKKPWHSGETFEDSPGPADAHPISLLMTEADKSWRAYENSRSTTFRQTVGKYRNKYGRHPPPGFKDWYQYARKRNVHNIDDFEQIMGDIRPFWAIEPPILRNLAANMAKKVDDGVSTIHIRNHKVVKVINGSWRSETLVKLINKFVKYLPDLDIAMNRLDQPRVVVEWDTMQEHLKKELETRQTPPEAIDEFSSNLPGLLNMTSEDVNAPLEDAGWYPAHGKPYMKIARTACPPESHAAKNDTDTAEAENMYKNRSGGIITNFNRSTDLCTVGPEIQDKHGFLFSASTVIATKRLVPIFGECKVNVNSDILFPANMYWMHDDRYDYNSKHDAKWDKKHDAMVWRGVTSGGVQIAENWRRMHRQRLVMFLNGTVMEDQEVRILTEQPEKRGEYENYRQFHPSAFARNHTDVGFTEVWGCVPDCNFYNNIWTLKNQMPLPEQFRYKFLVDVDGHSFSGRWRAFLESRSLGVKATIFREWHDSRLFAWRHFVPMDNRYDDLYSLLTYFLGVGTPPQQRTGSPANANANEKAYIARHDAEGKRIADQGREWAKKVLRRDDIEVSLQAMIDHVRTVIDPRLDIHVSPSH